MEVEPVDDGRDELLLTAEPLVIPVESERIVDAVEGVGYADDIAGAFGYLETICRVYPLRFADTEQLLTGEDACLADWRLNHERKEGGSQLRLFENRHFVLRHRRKRVIFGKGTGGGGYQLGRGGQIA